MNKRIFVTGISTDVGKTWASAIVCKSLNADYFKPIQTGFPEYSDTAFLKSVISDPEVTIHPPGLVFKDPLSPDAAAENENRTIKLADIQFPKTNNTLIYEGAGGLLVPVNDQETIADLIDLTDYVILVSRHYLGSINHTLLSLEFLKNKGIENVGIIFSGEENKATESVIRNMGKVAIIGRIPQLDLGLTSELAHQLAIEFHPNLSKLLRS